MCRIIIMFYNCSFLSFGNVWKILVSLWKQSLLRNNIVQLCALFSNRPLIWCAALWRRCCKIYRYVAAPISTKQFIWRDQLCVQFWVILDDNWCGKIFLDFQSHQKYFYIIPSWKILSGLLLNRYSTKIFRSFVN
jgi:hypothetical protein